MITEQLSKRLEHRSHMEDFMCPHIWRKLRKTPSGRQQAHCHTHTGLRTVTAVRNYIRTR